MWACLPSLKDKGAEGWKPPSLRGPLSTCPSCSQAECKKEMLDVKFMADTRLPTQASLWAESAFERVNIKVRSCRVSGFGAQGPGLCRAASDVLPTLPPATDG